MNKVGIFGYCIFLLLLSISQIASSESAGFNSTAEVKNVETFLNNEISLAEKFDLCNKDKFCKDNPNFCDDQMNECRKEVQKIGELLREKSRLSAYKPNTIAFLQYTDGDQYATEVTYSFKYMFSRPDCFYDMGDEKKECIAKWDERVDKFFSYTGKFDFYAGGTGIRESGPVINRVSNPAFHWRDHKPRNIPVEWIDYGIEHRSNGQTTSHKLQDAAGNYIANEKWRAGDRAYIDGISRGSNYFSVEMKDNFNISESKKVDYWISGKAYFTEDSEVTWGDGKYQGHKIWDYDLARIVFQFKEPISYKYLKRFEYNIEYTFGAKGFDTHSLNASIHMPFVLENRFLLPLFFRIHVGPMNELSNYTVSETSIYFGITLNPFPEK